MLPLKFVLCLSRSCCSKGPCNVLLCCKLLLCLVQVVEPKRVALGEAEALLLAANAQLQEKQGALAEVQAKVEGLKQALAGAQEEQAQLRAQASTTSTRLQRAAKLTSGLQEEGIRWGFTAAQLKVCILCLLYADCNFN